MFKAQPTTSSLASGGERLLEPISKITTWGCRRLTKCKSNLESLSTVRPPTPRKVICAERDKFRPRRTLASALLDKNNSKRRAKKWPIVRTWGLGEMANFKNNKKDILNSESEGRRCAVVKFAKLVTSGDQEDDFGEHSLSFPLLYFFFLSSSFFFCNCCKKTIIITTTTWQQVKNKTKNKTKHRAVFTWLSKGIGFGFGFTTPFGWLVYLLWFWFYDSQVKTALIVMATYFERASPMDLST